jgi:hypothetical protein
MTTASRAKAVTSLNLSAIFGEKDVPTRLENIRNYWVPSGEAFFVDPSSVFRTHGEISGMVDQILALGGPNDEFIELSE